MSKIRNRTDGIIIHSMGEYVNDIYCIDLLENMGLSAHYFVGPDGYIITQSKHDEVAHHAGKSKWKNWNNLNNNFIGIEVLVEGNHDYKSFVEAISKSDTFFEEQYISVAKLCRELMDIYPNIVLDNIVRHSDVSGKDVRIDPKVDPGAGFDMDKLKYMI